VNIQLEVTETQSALFADNEHHPALLASFMIMAPCINIQT